MLLGEAFIFISEGYEFLRPEILNYEEQTLYKINEEGKRELKVHTYSFQPEVLKFLEKSGYVREFEYAENVYDITDNLPTIEIPDGFDIITLDKVEISDYKKT